MTFPTDFEHKTQSIPADKLGPKARQAFDNLAERGFEVRIGLTPDLSQAITKMTHEPSILEYCPKDSSERFTDQAATQKWLSKGRAAFVLVENDEPGGSILVGYGWVGAGTSSHVPGGETTFALRIGEAGQGQGLATPFSQLMIAGATVMFDAKKAWLETWQSNGGAVHIYHKLGFKDVDQEDAERPRPNGEKVADTRLYMTLSDDLLNA